MILPAQHDNSENIDQARRAFSAQAPLFDSYEKSNIILQWMRRQVYKHEEKFLSPGDSIFELNAGTGIDAVHFAQQGHSVFAIDLAEGMIAELEKKVNFLQLTEKVSYARCSFTDLHSLPAGRFDHVFSNFGGLNCIPDLGIVARQLPVFLKPGATVTLVIMPRVCPWELLHILAENSTLAFRRLSRKGTTAHIEGHHFTTYYFSPEDVTRSFGTRFRLVRLRGLASISPPPYMSLFFGRHPGLYTVLTMLDELFSAIPPFNRWADHYIITLKYTA
jgi:ubiquinone/menaquinone biosynthesis C-methylase UbiE